MIHIDIYKLILGAALAWAITACSEHDQALPDSNPNNGYPVTLIATQDGVQSRMTHTEVGDKMVVKWEVNDAFALYGNNRFKFVAGEPENDGKSATFTCSSFEDEATNFNAFFPYSENVDTWQECFFDVSEQTQNGNANTAHLQKRNYMTATLNSGLSGGETIKISFKQEMALLKFYIAFSPGESYTPTRFTLSAGGLYTKKGISDPKLNETGSLVLKIENAGSASFFTAYMMAIPGKLTGEFLLTVEAKNDRGNLVFNYSTTITSDFEYKAGYFYTSNLRLEESTNVKEASVFNNTVAAESLEGTDPNYTINNAAQLKYFVNQVNGGNSYEGKTIELNTDIHITADTWEPIGKNSDNPFKGTFDGGNHIISGTMTASFTNSFGFFGHVKGNNANIKNLKVSAEIKSSQSRDFIYVGGIAGEISANATITNCHKVGGSVSASSSVNAPGTTTIHTYSGGIVGNNNGDGSISNCTNSGTVSASAAASASYVDTYANSGGIVGNNNGNGNISNCTNSGAVSASAASSAPYASSYANSGGIVGYIGSWNFQVFQDNQSNNNAIKATSNGANNYAGVFVGWADTAFETDIANHTGNTKGAVFPDNMKDVGSINNGEGVDFPPSN